MTKLVWFLLAAVGVLLASPAFATCPAFIWSDGTNSGNAASVCTAHNSGGSTYTPSSGTASYPTALGQNGYCDVTSIYAGICGSPPAYSTSCTSVITNYLNMSSVAGGGSPGGAGSCPTSACSALSGQYVSSALSSANPVTGAVCVGGCNTAATVAGPAVSLPGGGAPTTIQTLQYDGTSCSGGTTGAPAGCVLSGGATACNESVTPGGALSGKNCGTFNGDQVCVDSLPPGTCQSYPSGGVACTAATGSLAPASPPAPDNGTGGTPATPSAVVATQAGATGADTVSYYASSVTNSSSVPTAVTNNSGPSSGSGGSSGGPSAANGDCGAAGVDCTGTLPAADASDGTFSSVDAAFWSSIQSAPIVAALGAMESSWPSGSCPTVTISLATFPGHTYDYGSTMCSLWSSYVATPLAASMLVVWSILGVLILLSA